MTDTDSTGWGELVLGDGDAAAVAAVDFRKVPLANGKSIEVPTVVAVAAGVGVAAYR